MRIYILKFVVAVIALYILFKITIGSVITSFNTKIERIMNQSHRIEIKEKIFLEMKKGSEKENLFTKSERVILSNFLKKIINELNINTIQ